MTDFYAYFELTTRVVDRVGAVSSEVALAETPTSFDLFQRLKAPGGAYPRMQSLSIELIDVVPHFQAEEFARHAFMLEEAPREPWAPAWSKREPERPGGYQYLWRVEVDLQIRCAHIVSAPSMALAGERTMEMLHVIVDTGLDAIEPADAGMARVQPVSATPWAPDGFAHLQAGVAQ